MAECPSTFPPSPPLSVRYLDESLLDLVEWERVALYLPKFDQPMIDAIKKDHPNDTKAQKQTLYDRWLKACPHGTRSNVVYALEKAEEITLAQKIQLNQVGVSGGSLSVMSLDESLKDLVHWESMAMHLPEIKQSMIAFIKKDHPGIVDQKIALYKKWLKVCPDASWSNVADALEIAGERKLADQIRCNLVHDEAIQAQHSVHISKKVHEAAVLPSQYDKVAHTRQQSGNTSSLKSGDIYENKKQARRKEQDSIKTAYDNIHKNKKIGQDFKKVAVGLSPSTSYKSDDEHEKKQVGQNAASGLCDSTVTSTILAKSPNLRTSSPLLPPAFIGKYDIAAEQDTPRSGLRDDNFHQKVFDRFHPLSEAALKLCQQLNLSSHEKDELLKNLETWESKNDKCISVLVTGKTGSGKSTLINGILGFKSYADDGAAKEGHKLGVPCQRDVKPHWKNENGVAVTVWDSPGLGDGTTHQEGYLQQMKDNCSNVDFVLYCIKIIDTRFISGSDNPDVLAMRDLTKAFGPQLWEKTVFILTFANVLEIFHVECGRDLPPDEKIKAFNACILEWKDRIKLILVENIAKVPPEIVDKIAVIPAGHYRKSDLIGQERWLSNLWLQCLVSIPSVQTRCALLQINIDRLKESNEVEENYLQRPIDQQPLVVEDHILINGFAGVTRAILGALRW